MRVVALAETYAFGNPATPPVVGAEVPTTRQQAAAALGAAFHDASLALARGTVLSAATLHEMRRISELMVLNISCNPIRARRQHDSATEDCWMVRHSLSVTVVGLSLGIRVLTKYGWTDERGRRRYDGLSDRLTALGVGLLLHDIGKLAVPSEILQKPERLTPDEWEAMRAHPTRGAEILPADISPLARAVVRSHHERWDGAGYPDGLAAGTIHQFARIAAVADVFDALTSKRYYRQAMPIWDAYDYIVSRSGKDFDPQVIEVFRECMAPSELYFAVSN
jgi:HD-GYP domain-containing protein (c-di-GMP phosphodiesterase class II)